MKKVKETIPDIRTRFEMSFIAKGYTQEEARSCYESICKNGVDYFVRTGFIHKELLEFILLIFEDISTDWLLFGKGEQESRLHFYRGLHDSSHERFMSANKELRELRKELNDLRNGGKELKPEILREGKIIIMKFK